jgi:hypothetical protein
LEWSVALAFRDGRIGSEPVQDSLYFDQDEARLKAWRNDEWHFIGIRAKATIKIPYGANPECWITSEIFSPGLWGIEI